jgi:hypothetical protein
MTLLEVMISSAIMLLIIGGFLGAVRTCSKSVVFHGAVTTQMRESQELVDQMLVGMRWVSHADNAVIVSGVSEPPKFSFQEVAGRDVDFNPIFGDRITYYWLPSAAENSTYAGGDVDLDLADIDGVDHDGNGVRNDGVIWRKIEALPAGKDHPDDLGLESFDGVGATVTSVVFTHVPPPFYRDGGGALHPLDSFKVSVNTAEHTVTLTIKRFVETGEPVVPDMVPFPADVAGSGPALASDTITVMATQRLFCIRN